MVHSDNHIFTGLQQDISMSKHPAHLLCDALNIRMTAREGQTALSITNEKGPSEVSLSFKYFDGNQWKPQKEYNESTKSYEELTSLEGIYIGHCVLNNYIVVFTHSSNGDSIYRIDVENRIATRICYGSLNFSENTPIQALVSYENENIQKVYWTDNHNQPRMINIAPTEDLSKMWEDEEDDTIVGITYRPQILDFSPELSLTESVSVTKRYSGGSFASGVIQYAITYFNKYAQETAIAVTTPLYYISPYGRGGSPEEICNNSFVIKITNVDTKFKYLRLYSIHRTSLNGTPICKRLQDIEINSQEVSYIDNGTSGEVIDPTSLLFLGGEEIKAETMCQKDGTMFLGNITLKRPAITGEAKQAIQNYFSTNKSSPVNTTSSAKLRYRQRECKSTKVIKSGDFVYASTLEENCAGFKKQEYYRLGLQFQYKTGAWSEPVWIMDHQIVNIPNVSSYGTYSIGMTTEGVPLNSIIYTNLNSNLASTLGSLGYKKVRAMIAAPSLTNRTVIFQGVYNPTMYRPCDRYGTSPDDEQVTFDGVGHLHAQASWIFRPGTPTVADKKYDWKANQYGGIISGGYWGGPLVSQYNTPIGQNNTVSPYQYSTEIQGLFTLNGSFYVEDGASGMFTINSPDIIWDPDVCEYNFSNSCKLGRVGYINCLCDYGDLDIITASGTIGSSGAGFVHRALRTDGNAGLISQPCYQDCVVDDKSATTYGVNDTLKYPVMWVAYMWHRNGSLNNDVNRDGRSAMLQTKRISNYRIGETFQYGGRLEYQIQDIKVFNSEELSYLKVNGLPYMGNIDTMITPNRSGFYFGGEGPKDADWEYNANYKSNLSNRLIGGKKNEVTDVGLWQKWDTTNNKWTPESGGSGEWTTFGDQVPGLGAFREGIRIKYKSTPHAIVYGTRVTVPEISGGQETGECKPSTIPIVEVYEPYNKDTFYGGVSSDAMMAITWIPAGPAVSLTSTIQWEWGDTFFNRWDCLKTYAFTKEDQNQVVDILSFPVESHINLDGRYDKNRGQSSNLNASPINYNLMNMVYSQLDNFFSYRIMEEDYYKLNSFGNQVTWTLEKNAASEIDTWTNVTLASTYDLDGSKGQIRALRTWKDSIYCFQDSGISNLLFNSRVQIQTSDNVPIEIGNSYKLEGKRYISDSIGCINPSSICETPSGLYFIDSIASDLHVVGGNTLMNVSNKYNMTTWFQGEVSNEKWTPNSYTSKVFYDNGNQDIYVTTEDQSLCFSETLMQFTSFMSYEDIPAMFNISSKLYVLKSVGGALKLWEMFGGRYNYFFDSYKDFGISFISNDNSGVDKIFTNLEAQVDFYDTVQDSEKESFPHKTNTINNRNLNPKRFFDYIRVQNEYQDTSTQALTWKNFKSFHNSASFKNSNTAKKYRIWRVDIPRDRSSYTEEAQNGVQVLIPPKLFDRIRNVWAKISLHSTPSDDVFMELHNLSIIYHT